MTAPARLTARKTPHSTLDIEGMVDVPPEWEGCILTAEFRHSEDTGYAENDPSRPFTATIFTVSGCEIWDGRTPMWIDRDTLAEKVGEDVVAWIEEIQAEAV